MKFSKYIFITVAEDIIARNILQTNFPSKFFSQIDADVAVLFLVQPDRVEYFTKQYENDDRIVVVGYKRSKMTRIESFVTSLMRSGIDTHTNLWSKMRSYYRGDSSFLDTWVKRAHAATFGNWQLYKKFLRRLFILCAHDDVADKLFDTYRPIQLITLSLTNFDFDVILARTAKQRKIPIIAMVRSWDNLSSHGLLRVLPDRFILQNHFLEDMARQHQAVGDLKIDIVGVPHYDGLVSSQDILMSKKEFCTMYKLDPNRPIIFYGAMGETLFIKEGELPRIFEELILAGQLPNDAQILFRAHPKFKPTDTKFLPHIFFDLGGVYVEKDMKNGGITQKDLINQIYHSDVVVTGASTIAIDAAIQNKPIVCVAFDGNSKVRYWESAKRFYDRYTHFEALVSTGGVLVAQNKDELAKQIMQSIQNPNEFHNQRNSIVEMFVGKVDGLAADRLASIMAGYCK